MPGMSDVSKHTPPDDDAPPVRAAWVAGAETFGRFGRVLQPLAVGLVDEMVGITVLLPGSADCPELETVPHEAAVYPPARWWRIGGRWLDAVAADLKRRKIDLLHALDGSAGRLTRTLARRLDVPYVLSSYALDDTWRLSEAGREAAAVLAASEPLRDALADRAVAPAERLRLMRPGVYHVRRPTCFDDPTHSIAIVAGGPLADLPACDAVLQCFAELAARKYDCAFFFLGTGPAERRLRQRAEQRKLLAHLTFADCRPMGQLTGIFKAADVFIAPVAHDGIDMQTLLAMAAGVPVLAAAGGAVSDFLRDGETATFFTQGDSAELTVKLTALLDDRASARALAASAIEYVHRNHSPAVNVTALAHIYHEALANRSAG